MHQAVRSATIFGFNTATLQPREHCKILLKLGHKISGIFINSREPSKGRVGFLVEIEKSPVL